MRLFKDRPRGRCVYCRVRRAVNRDHVVPQSLAKTHPFVYTYLPAELKRTVSSCFECNIAKGSRRLVPLAWERHLPALTEAFPGTPWRVWDGSVEALRQVVL